MKALERSHFDLGSVATRIRQFSIVVLNNTCQDNALNRVDVMRP